MELDDRAGYRTDIAYPAHFHPEQAPAWLAAVLAALGHAPPAPAAWCEIGCGDGLGALILAAANPEVQFTGIDLNPAHIAAARARAAAARIGNIRFLCADLREIGPLPARFSHIVSHGMLSWVGADVRAAFAAFAAAHLAPGGVVAVQYMSAPGGAALRAFHTVLRQMAGRPDPVAEGLALLREMRAAQAGFFQLHAHAGAALDQLLAMDPAYIAHGYMNPVFEPLAFAEVAASFAAVGLEWQGSATPIENAEALSLPAACLPQIAATPDPVLRETLKDIARNQTTRYDLFGAPAPAKGPADHLRLLDARVWGLLPGAPVPEGLRFETRIGPVEGDARILGPLLQRLAQGPARFGELLRLPAFAGHPAVLNQCLLLLLSAHILHPVQRFGPPGAAARLNRLLLAGDAPVPALAAPALGSGRALTPELRGALRSGAGPAPLRQMFALDVEARTLP